MTPERDIERVLEAWLEPGSSTMPDRVFDAVVDRIERVPQRRTWRLDKRFHAMPTLLKATSAAVLILAIGFGVGRLQPTGPYGAEPSPSPSPLPSPTARLPLLPTAYAALDPGTYALGGVRADPFRRMTATVPNGWSGIRGDTFVNLFQDADEFPEGSIGLALPDNFFVDPCDTSAGLMDPPLGPTVDDFMTALAEVPGYQVTEPVDVTLFGYRGKYVEEIGRPSVAECADGFSHPWHTKYDETAPYDQADQHHRIWVLDVDGTRLLVSLVGSNAAPHPTGGDPVSLAEQQQVLDSIRIAPPPSATPSQSPMP